MSQCKPDTGGHCYHCQCFPSFLCSLEGQGVMGSPGDGQVWPLFFSPVPFFLHRSYFRLKLCSQGLLKSPQQQASLGRKWGSCEAGELSWGVKGVGGHSGNRGPEKPHTGGTWKGPHSVAPTPASVSSLGVSSGLCLILSASPPPASGPHCGPSPVRMVETTAIDCGLTMFQQLCLHLTFDLHTQLGGRKPRSREVKPPALDHTARKC